MEAVKKQTLENGLTLLSIPQKGAKSMTFLVLVKVGSRYETKENSGASHFIEHMMFKGTRKRPSTLHISKELDAYGAEYNAYTGKDLTGYYIKMDAEHTETAVDMLHDMLYHSVYDPKEINRERQVITEEIKMYEDNPREHISDLLESHLYANSPLGMNIAGTRDTVGRMTREDLINYRDTYYIPSRLTVVVSGKINPGVLDLIKKTFGKIKQPKKPKDLPFACFAEPAKAKPIFGLQKKATEQTQLALSFYGVPFGHQDREAARVLANILGGSMSSRLFIEIRERRGLCYAVGAGHESLEDTGAFTVTAGLDHGRLKEAMAAILNELQKIVKTPVTSEELERSKSHFKGRMALALEDSSVRAEWYGRQWLYERKLESPEKKIKIIDSVSKADVQRIAAHILVPQKMVVAAIGPTATPNQISQLVTWK